MSAPQTTRDVLDHVLGRIRRCLSFWRRALLVFVVTALAAGPFSITRPRTYRSETVILYQERIRSVDLTGTGGDGPAESTRRLGARLREALLSRASLEPIVLDLRLYPRIVQVQGLIDAVDEMRKHVTFRTREGDTFEIAFEGNSPEEAQEVTRRLADSIVREAATRRSEHAKTLKEFVDAESKRNKAELKTEEAALASFLAIHPELRRAPGWEPPPPPPPRLVLVEGVTIASLEWRAARIEAQLNAAPSAHGSPAPAVAGATSKPRERVPDSPEVIAAKKDLADKLGRFTDRHPDVLASRARLRAAEAAAAAAAPAETYAAAGPQVATSLDAFDAPATNDPGASAPDDRAALRGELASVRAQIAARRASGNAGGAASSGAAASASASASASPSDSAAPAPIVESGPVALEVELRRLQREVSDTRERQRLLDEKQFKASITASSVTNDRNVQVSVLDPAFRPTHPVTRPRSVLLGTALAICLLLALLTACVSAWLDDRIHSRVEIEQLALIPVFAVIPRLEVRALRRNNDDG